MSVQVLVVAPTREIAVQSCDTLRCLGCALPGLGCYAFIGGLPVKEDLAKLVGCHIAVATLGEHLLEHATVTSCSKNRLISERGCE